MGRYMIEKVNLGTAGGPPGDFTYIAEGKFKSGEEEFFVSVSNLNEFVMAFKTDQSTIVEQVGDDVDDDFDDEKFYEELCKHEIFNGSYKDLDDLKDTKYSQYYDIVRYLTYIAYEEEEKVNNLIKETEGKYIDEITIPSIGS
jgi:hypothetical protein